MAILTTWLLGVTVVAGSLHAQSFTEQAALQAENQADVSGYVDVLISFRSDVSWDQGVMPVTKAEKGMYVYEKLSRDAARTQAPVREFLSQKGIPYTAFCVVNAIHATIPVAELGHLTQFGDIRQITANSPFRQEQAERTREIDLRSAGPEWGIIHIGADSVWALGFTGQGVVIGGQDTGYDWEHPAISSTYRGMAGDSITHHYNWHDAIHEINPLNGDSIILPENNPCGLDSPIPCDDHGHGTHTMGTMVGADGENQIGVAPGARWIACRNMERGWGSPATYLECMEWFLAPTDGEGQNPDPTMAPHVINNSWSCPELEGCNPDNFALMRQAVVNLRAAGIVMVVSAGNSGSGCGSVSTPLAMFEESFTVGAINAGDTIAGFSSRGPVVADSSMRMKPNVCAPGVQVRSAGLDSTYRTLNGTSMAGPHVAGAVALMISANPDLAGQVEVIESILEATARPRVTEQECGGVSGQEPVNNTFGYGVIDALAAVQAALLVSSTRDADEDAERGLVCFPNPVTNDLHVAGNTVTRIHQLGIYTMDGRLIASWQDIQLPHVMDVRMLPQGLYVVRADGYRPELISVIRP